jgi:hypothetical protein
MTSEPLKKRDFDCVEMMHEGAAAVRAELAGMSVEEQIAYWQAATEDLLARQAALRAARGEDREGV